MTKLTAVTEPEVRLLKEEWDEISLHVRLSRPAYRQLLVMMDFWQLTAEEVIGGLIDRASEEVEQSPVRRRHAVS